MHTSAPSSSSSCVENMGPDHVKFIETVNKYIDKITAHVNNNDKVYMHSLNYIKFLFFSHLNSTNIRISYRI